MKKDVELIEVVRTRLERRGRGIEEDPFRVITQYWSKEGELLAEVDPYEKTFDYEKERERFYSELLPEVCKECEIESAGKAQKKRVKKR